MSGRRDSGLCHREIKAIEPAGRGVPQSEWSSSSLSDLHLSVVQDQQCFLPRSSAVSCSSVSDVTQT